MFTDFDSYDPNWNVQDKCHIVIQGKEKNSDKQIIISTWQSIYKLPTNYFETFDVVMGDEAHLYKAKSLTSILNKMTNAKYRFGTTGTLDDTQTHQLVLEGMFGELFNTSSTKSLIDAEYLAKFSITALVLKYSEDVSKEVSTMKYQEEMDFIVKYDKRNKFIRNLVIDQKGNTLLLFQYVEKHGKILYDLITEKADDDRKVFFVHGGVDGDQREEVRRITEQEGDAIIVASYGTFSTGINIRNLHNIVFASSSKSKIRNLQSIGRGLRKGDNKKEAKLFDIADDFRYKSKQNYTLGHFNERIKQYNEQDFEYSIFTINL
jgi:superfamily II DNA or RNA helicase